MREPNENDINIDSGTLLMFVFALLLLPLLFVGFLSQ